MDVVYGVNLIKTGENTKFLLQNKANMYGHMDTVYSLFNFFLHLCGLVPTAESQLCRYTAISHCYDCDIALIQQFDGMSM